LAAKRADFARTVPLGNAATGSCPQQPEIQHPLDFRGGVAVNLASEANFFQFRAGPDLFHGSLLFACSFLEGLYDLTVRAGHLVLDSLVFPVRAVGITLVLLDYARGFSS